jgi:hypothetical protein
MRKLFATAIAAGAVAISGAASAQDVGTVIANLFGLGTPTYGYNSGYPAVVAPQQQLYRDTYGRTFYYDQYGRQVYLNSVSSGSQFMGYDAWGRPVYSSSTSTPAYVYGGNYPYNSGYAYNNGYAYNSRSWDRDGDGISNGRDRWPDDPRYR